MKVTQRLFIFICQCVRLCKETNRVVQVSASWILHPRCLICFFLLLSLVLAQYLAHNQSSIHTCQMSYALLDEWNLKHIIYCWNRYPKKIVFSPSTFWKVENYHHIVSTRNRFHLIIEERGHVDLVQRCFSNSAKHLPFLGLIGRTLMIDLFLQEIC